MKDEGERMKKDQKTKAGRQVDPDNVFHQSPRMFLLSYLMLPSSCFMFNPSSFILQPSSFILS